MSYYRYYILLNQSGRPPKVGSDYVVLDWSDKPGRSKRKMSIQNESIVLSPVVWHSGRQPMWHLWHHMTHQHKIRMSGCFLPLFSKFDSDPSLLTLLIPLPTPSPPLYKTGLKSEKCVLSKDQDMSGGDCLVWFGLWLELAQSAQMLPWTSMQICTVTKHQVTEKRCRCFIKNHAALTCVQCSQYEGWWTV